MAGILCYSPNASSCPSSQQQHPEHRPAVAVAGMPRGRPALCRSLWSVSGIQQGKTSQRGEQTHFKQRFPFPSQDVHDAAGLFHLHEPSSTHSFSPWRRQNQDFPKVKTEPGHSFPCSQGCKAPNSSFHTFYCLSEKKYLERLKCRAASRAGHSRNLIWFICSGTFKPAPNSPTGVFIVLLEYLLLLSELWM